MKAWVLPLLASSCWLGTINCGSSFRAGPNGSEAGASEGGEAGERESSAGEAGASARGGSASGGVGGSVGQGGSSMVGGASGVGGSVTSEPTIASASTAYALARCSRYQACLPARFAGYYSGQADCVRDSELTAAASFTLPGSTVTPKGLTQCAADRAAQACADFSEQRPASCLTAGTLANGAACNVDAQCSSTFCYVESESIDPCGVCAPRVGLGAACKRDGCAPGLSCVDAGGKGVVTCEALLKEGAACDNNTECAADLRCLDGSCARMPAVGEPCEALVLCRDGEGDQCVTTTSSSSDNTCLKATFGAPGQACDYATARNCLGASVCLTATSLCSPIAKLGEACSDTTTPCEHPYVCSGAQCALPPPVTVCR